MTQEDLEKALKEDLDAINEILSHYGHEIDPDNRWWE